MGYLLDSNVFDKIIESGCAKNIASSSVSLFVTNVQLSELKNIPNQGKREELLELLHVLHPHKLILESGVWLDDLYWDDNQQWRDEVGPDCTQYIQGKENIPWKDALTAEVAKKWELVIVSEDKEFRKKSLRLGIRAIEYNEFIEELGAQQVAGGDAVR